MTMPYTLCDIGLTCKPYSAFTARPPEAGDQTPESGQPIATIAMLPITHHAEPPITVGGFVYWC
jgi:hypothetical protein